jgi:hypothetical protein
MQELLAAGPEFWELQILEAAVAARRQTIRRHTAAGLAVLAL